MNPQNNVNKGEETRLQFVLPLDSGGRCEMTATVLLTALDDDRQTRLDAEIENLLRELIRQQGKDM